jgi:putative spermidine/putrescine transport system substrate-binding protein
MAGDADACVTRQLLGGEMNGMFTGKLKTLLTMTGAIGASVVLASAVYAQDVKDFDGEELIVQTYGGTLAIYFRDTFAKEFNEKFNADVQVEEGLSTDTVAKLRASGGVPHVDTFMVTEPWAVVLQAENLTEPLVAANMPSLAEIQEAARSEGNSYTVFSRTSMTMTYNTDLVEAEDLPKRWKDLADPKYKGLVTLPVPGNAHAVMLMAKLANLETGSLDSIDTAIADLKQIAPNVLTYWTSFDQAFNLLNSGQNTLSVNSMDRTIDQVKKGAPVRTYFPEEGTIFLGNTLGIAKGTEHRELAEAWINFILEKEQQVRVANDLGFVPVRSDIEIDPTVAALFPQGAALENSLYPNWGEIANKQADWIDRYTKEVAGQ